MASVWSCPDCGTDLTDGYCPDCQLSWSWAALAGWADPRDDYTEPHDGV